MARSFHTDFDREREIGTIVCIRLMRNLRRNMDGNLPGFAEGLGHGFIPAVEFLVNTAFFQSRVKSAREIWARVFKAQLSIINHDVIL